MNHHPLFRQTLALSLTALTLGACGTSDPAPNVTLSFAQLVPVVKEATPEGLTTSSTLLRSKARRSRSELNTLTAGTPATVAAAIEYVFTKTYGNINGDNVPSFFNSAIQVIDDRANQEGPGLASAGGDDCNNGAAYTPTITGFTVPTNISINPACYTIFASGGLAGEGSGYVYGNTTEDDGSTTLTSWLTLVQSNNIDKFAMLGKLTNADAATDAEKGAEVLFMEAGPAADGQWNRYTLYHIIATPAENKLEISLGSTSGGVMASAYEQNENEDDTNPGLGCGFQMVTDGVHIKASGKQMGASDVACSDADDFTNLCFNATTLAEASGECGSLSFTMSAINITEGMKAEIATSMMPAAATEAVAVTTP